MGGNPVTAVIVALLVAGFIAIDVALACRMGSVLKRNADEQSTPVQHPPEYDPALDWPDHYPDGSK